MTQSIKEKVDQLVIEKRAFIDGHYTQAVDGDTIKKFSSADGRDLSGISSCKQEDINAAVKAAKQSFESKIWLNKSPHEKKKILFKLADLIEENREELSLLDTLETGRCYKNFYNDSLEKSDWCCSILCRKY